MPVPPKTAILLTTILETSNQINNSSDNNLIFIGLYDINTMKCATKTNNLSYHGIQLEEKKNRTNYTQPQQSRVATVKSEQPI